MANELKLVARPTPFDGEHANWANWKFAMTNWLSLVDVGYVADLEGLQNRAEYAEIPPDDENQIRSGNTLFVLTSSLLMGKALVFAKSMTDRNGFELWRLLLQEFEPSQASRALIQLWR